MKAPRQPAQEEASYLAIEPWDIERWESSRAYRRMDLAAQGAYRNLCDKAWKAQPSCELPMDDRDLWRLSGARSLEAWQAIRAEVLDSDAWSLTGHEGTSCSRPDCGQKLLNEVVLEMYLESAARHKNAVRSGRAAGKASARARRAMSQAKASQQLRTAVQRPFNGGSTTVNPPSPSPSPSPSEDPPLSPPRATPEPETGPVAIVGHGTETDVVEALCQGQAKLTGRQPGTATADAFRRLLATGRTQPEIARVLEAYAGMRTESCVFARRGSPGHRGGPGLLWALKAGEAGGFDRILGQLDEADVLGELETPANGNGHHAPSAAAPEDPPSRDEAQVVWDRILAALESKLHRHSFATWYRATEGWSLEDGVLTVLAPAPGHAAWIRENSAERVAQALEACGLSYEVRFMAHGEA